MNKPLNIDPFAREYDTDPYDLFGRPIMPGDILVRPSPIQSDRLGFSRVREVKNGRVYLEEHTQPLKLPGRCMIVNHDLPASVAGGLPVLKDDNADIVTIVLPTRKSA